MAKPPIKVQQDLENHLGVYIKVLEDKGYDVDAVVLKEAILIMRKHYYAVLPNQCNMKRILLEALCGTEGLLSIDDLMAAAAKGRLIADRRRINVRLSEMKREELVTNPVRGFWKIDKAGRAYVKRVKTRRERRKGK